MEELKIKKKAFNPYPGETRTKKKVNKKIWFTLTLFFIIILLLTYIIYNLGKSSSPVGKVISERGLDGGVGDTGTDNKEYRTGNIEGTAKTSYIGGKSYEERDYLTNNIINTILMLRSASNDKDIINVAESVTNLQNDFVQLDKTEIKAGWQTIINCVYDHCNDKNYLDLIDIVAISFFDKDKNVLIHSFVQTIGYWDGQNIIEFSKSITETDRLMQMSNDKKIVELWNSVVECNGKCSEFDGLVFRMINEINS